MASDAARTAGLPQDRYLANDTNQDPLITPIPKQVRDLIRTRVRTMDHVEVLMRLHEAAGNPVVLSELQRTTHLDAKAVETVVADLLRAGLITRDADAYRSDPTSHQDRFAVNALAMAYHQQPLNLAKLVYEQPSKSLETFSDAFRLQQPKDKKDE
jgi:hypothetical protein